MQSMKILVRAFGWILLLLCLCWAMYCVIADYSYSAVSGIYKADVGGTTSILHLYANQTFDQDTGQGGSRQQVRGTWKRIGEGRVVFSKEFLRAENEEVRTDGEVDGAVEKIFGLFFTIHINPDPGGRVFYKRPFQFR
jgi:hypothetical protein